MAENSRTDKIFKNLASFAGEILVECPNCKKRAVVFAETGPYTVPYPVNYQAKFKCNNCYKPLGENLWYGPIVISPSNANCGHCGSRLTFSKTVDKYRDKIEVKCSNCMQEKEYSVHYAFTYANDRQATDPYFGLQLWLQMPFGDNILWAYNFEHLAYIKNYVRAELREAASGGKYSLAWKLPNFIKIKKNRQRVLKAIARLERM